ncbi:hypothetical protein [Paenibacillus brasilensis]|uniref:Uncharacterized protein n=1 Tax=Paenibacillus brasilensis TaxID=128574 RepID=A0ABU0L3F9_9BACL|nr:hypothetical protein [Paenibacillus brasilensis]MDQ0495717.1 hypothetical protein [Paenibacillus brasilensis]
MAQALIQQRFYVGAGQRFYEYDIVMALKALSCNFICKLTGCCGSVHAADHSGPGAVARHAMQPSIGLRLLCAYAYGCAPLWWLKASLLEPARSREGSGLFATQIRQPSRERGLR